MVGLNDLMNYSYDLEVANDSNDLAILSSQIIASQIDLALDQRDRAQVALSGGKTPSETYKLLSKEHLPWDRVDVFLGDERWVDPTDEESNALMIRNTLLLDGPGSRAIFHPVPTTEYVTPDLSANAFSELVQNSCKGTPPVFDLIVLGLGEDGHTASLFPGTQAVNVVDKWATVGLGKGKHRITLTSPVLSSARKVLFIVSGENKKSALQRLIDPLESSERTPARLVKPKSSVLVLADKSAAALL